VWDVYLGLTAKTIQPNFSATDCILSFNPPQEEYIKLSYKMAKIQLKDSLSLDLFVGANSSRH
ncbi:hypothetical protein PN441_18180, partial [Spirulina major CS-329]|uniref:hypothetical protein n=1 Tax=Spirulina major TaxID=270636 RepID=UPI00232D48BD